MIAELTMESIELDLREEITRLFKNYKHALHLYYNAILAKEAAEEDRDLVTKLYENDLVAVTRLNEVQKDMVDTTARFIKARVLVGEAWESILIATGRMRDGAANDYSLLNTNTETSGIDLFHFKNSVSIEAQ